MAWIRAKRRAVQSPGGVDPDGLRRHLGKILTSPEFSSASRLQQFLAFVVEERLHGVTSIKETELALRVFNRRSSFDPSGDSVVRVAASNLRSRLRDYYLKTGREDPLIIEMPKGTYVPVFRTRVPPGRPRAPLPWKAAAAAGCLFILAALVWWMLSARPHHSWSSIAVLPFLNLSSTPDSEFVTEGFVEDVTTALAQTQGLRVAARSSAFQFQGKSFDVRLAGRKLGVETVLEGSVRTAGSQVRITAQLVNVADGFHIWSHTWEGAPRDLAAIRAELARSVAGALRSPSKNR